MKNGIVEANGVELVGDTTLTKLLYARELCGLYSDEKLIDSWGNRCENGIK